MKKTLLATAIAGTMAATGAQAATVYDQDGTKLDVYGRLAYGVVAGGATDEDQTDFIDLGSRWGFIANHDVTSDLSTYARMEFRGKADARNDDGFDTIRNTYVGVNSDSWGDVRIGNFDSIFYQMVSVVHDVPENAGATNIDFGQVGAHGDQIQYTTPNLSGFKAAVAAKHISGRDAGSSGDSTLNWHAGVSYEIDDLYLGLAYNQSNQADDANDGNYDGPGAKSYSEDLWGLVARYNFTPEFSGRFTYQEVGDVTADQATIENENPNSVVDGLDGIDNLWGLGGSYDYGMGEVYGDYYRADMIDDRLDDQNRWVLGANYRFSEPMYVFAELYQEDFDADDSINDVSDDIQTTVGVRYDF
ncbi:MAG: porin [Halomonas sp.]